MKRKQSPAKNRSHAKNPHKLPEGPEEREVFLGMKVLDELRVLARLARPQRWE